MWTIKNLLWLIVESVEFYIDGVWAPRFCSRRGHTPYEPFRTGGDVHCKVCWEKLSGEITWADVGRDIIESKGDETLDYS
jgi:hypothetical protein